MFQESTSLYSHNCTHTHTQSWTFASEQLQGVLYVPFVRQSGSSHLRALDCESAPSEWTTEAFASEVSQFPGDTFHKRHQAPSEHLPRKKPRGKHSSGNKNTEIQHILKTYTQRKCRLITGHDR